MATAKEFLTEFTKEIINHPLERQTLIAGYASHMEARERECARAALTTVRDSLNDNRITTISTALAIVDSRLKDYNHDTTQTENH